MKASAAKLLDFLKKSQQFIIPIYQRMYSWERAQCQQLWNDILRAGGDESIGGHFIGMVVYIEKGLYQVSSGSPLLVIDGQQRLTTAMLLIEALARRVGDEEPYPEFSAKKLRNRYLVDDREDGDERYKLLLTETDKDTFLAVMNQKPWPAHPSHRIQANFEFFEEKLASLKDLSVFCRGLGKLMIVDVALTRDQDNPQLIFESMNSTGRALSQADLIRNYVLMGLEPNHQRRLYEEHWRPMELGFGQRAYAEYFDAFMRYYLTVRTGSLPRLGDVYDDFKTFAQKPEQRQAGVDALMADIHTFAGYYCAMHLGQERDAALKDAFSDLRELKMDVTYPLFLELYHDYATGILSKADFLSALRLVESYLFRRLVCAIPTTSQNKTFATIGRTLTKDRYLESLQARLLSLATYKRFPNDDEFKRALSSCDLYNFRTRLYWLRRLENDGRKERVAVANYTVEHILPQNEKLSAEWQEALGPDWKQVQATWLHTLGNLTLTGYNSEYGDRPFARKRDMTGGFKESPLRLNEGLGALETWNSDTIQARAKRLAERAVAVWPAPSLSPEVQARYTAPAKIRNNDIGGFKHLAEGTPTRELYDQLNQEVLALDDDVYCETLTRYIAFKLETNFLDVEPQMRGLKLTLNLPFDRLIDEQGIANDVSNKKKWTNGDARFLMTSLDELPYVMSLVRQALDYQLDASGEGE